MIWGSVVDDASLAYLEATTRPFQNLRQASGHLSVLLILAASRREEVPIEQPVYAASQHLISEALEEIGGIMPPRS